MELQPLILTACNDDILRLIVANLDAARDVFALSLSCKSLYQFVRAEGWRVFVRRRFPWFSLQAVGSDDWAKFAQSLRFQTRCWERRSFKFRTFLQDPGASLGSYGPRRRGVPFQAMVDAYFDPEAETELVVWGAGEDIVGRWRQKGGVRGSSLVAWHESLGVDGGYAPGPDDVTALRLMRGPVGQHDELGILVGRDNGHLRLLSAEQDRFGRLLVDLAPRHAHAPALAESEQETINSLDVSYHDRPQGQVVAATQSSLLFYNLPGDSASKRVGPSAVRDLKRDLFDDGNKKAALCSAKWMGGDIVAFTLKGTDHPLRYLKVTESGVTYHTAAKNPLLQSEHRLRYRNVCPNSLQPVRRSYYNRAEANLLLSAWKDGTVRLQDLRSPSAFDAIYQDNINPTETLETLLVSDSERFLGASGTDLTVKIFDLRWDRPYHHLSELECSSQAPLPPPRQPFLSEPPEPTEHRTACEHLLGRHCRWHALSRLQYYQPNAKLFLVESHGAHISTSRRIWSLARASPVSPNFYLGISGGIVEASMEPSLDPPGVVAPRVRRDANFAFTDWDAPDQGASCSYVSRVLVPGIQEIGDGLASPHNQRPIKLPPLVSARDWGMEMSQAVPEEWKARHRLDRCFQRIDDFAGLRGQDGVVVHEDVEDGIVLSGDAASGSRWSRIPRGRR
ncbi:hypothetical protein GQ53DRAFT_751894 [Thozetella sp. PMI_491]|nr:hypothetical protein GQ53DRAFT_751894 [Thozetella sp. PMI_491]